MTTQKTTTKAATRQADVQAPRQDQPLARRDEPQPDQPMMTKISVDDQQRMIEDLRHMQRLPKDAQEHEIAYFAEVCRRTGLSPFSMPPQIYMVARWDNKLNRNACTIQTGIDGYRLVSDDRIDGMDAPVFVYSEDGTVISATCTVYRKGCSRPFSATAYYAEYVQTTKDGKPTSMWRDKPHVMLAKCAEALVRRMAFPMLLSGLYTAEEMAQAENPVVATTEPQAPRREAPAVVRVVEAAPASGSVWDRIVTLCRGDVMLAAHATCKGLSAVGREVPDAKDRAACEKAANAVPRGEQAAFGEAAKALVDKARAAARASDAAAQAPAPAIDPDDTSEDPAPDEPVNG